MKRRFLAPVVLASLAMTLIQPIRADENPEPAEPSVATVIARVRAHDFHPIRDGFTHDRHLDRHGVANLDDRDWKVRTLAVRDLVRTDDAAAVIAALDDDDRHVRYLAAMALGIRRTKSAVPALEARLADLDEPSTVRSQAAIALGQIGQSSSLETLRRAREADPSRDVTHQAEIAIHAIGSGQPATPELAEAWKSLDPASFGIAKVGQPAPDFALPDTDGDTFRLADFRGEKAVALIWIFADWCPVCHGEFRELIELKDQFREAGIQPVTLECHDLLPARIMVGEELDPKYWFAEHSFRETYTENIWWPHLVDRAAGVGVQYGIQPMAFAVHAEAINRPTVALIDREGVLRFLYRGTFWGDRPSVAKVLEMLRENDDEFESPKRLPSPDSP